MLTFLVVAILLALGYLVLGQITDIRQDEAILGRVAELDERMSRMLLQPANTCAACRRMVDDDPLPPVRIDDVTQLLFPARLVSVTYFICQECVAAAYPAAYATGRS
jgi:hypothetical protein